MITIASPAARALTVLLLLACVGCENGVKNMYQQPKYGPLSASPLWPDGRSARPLVADTVAHSQGEAAGSSSGRLGAVAPTVMAQPDYSLAALRRGRGRYDIYCAPCHGLTGDGRGYITLRGFPAPPTYHSDRLRAAPDEYLFEVISRGYGAMFPYADRLAPQDRWAVIAYVRALQLSQHARLADVPAGEQAQLEATP